MVLPAGALSVVVNTGDDFRLWGLHISPDLDTVMYTLADIANPETGWGVAGDTWRNMEMVARYGRDPWFRLGDLDLATHILRTQMLDEGHTLTEVTADLAGALNIRSTILPMCDEPVETLVSTEGGNLPFQDYFVRSRHSDRVSGFTFKGIVSAQPTTQVLEAIAGADAIVFCPSNPFVSVGPILAVPGMREALLEARGPKVAVSPIVGGVALKGPAADMLAALGHEVSPYGVALLYRGLLDGFVIDSVDEAHAPRIRDLGMKVLVTTAVMRSEGDRARLAQETLDFCASLAPSTR
jgi:LPPG:FO 2-phospho-L-lactate transferase